MARDDRYLWRTNPDGTRQVSWRLWVLVWVLPVVFALATIWLVLEVFIVRASTVQTTGTVTHVYKWENDAPRFIFPGDYVYSPRYRYTWTDGTETEATAGRSHTEWNFEIGSRHQIRYDPDVKGDVTLVSPTEWLVAKIIGLITICLTPLSLLLTLRIRRWLRGGTKTPSSGGAVRRM